MIISTTVGTQHLLLQTPYITTVVVDNYVSIVYPDHRFLLTPTHHFQWLCKWRWLPIVLIESQMVGMTNRDDRCRGDAA